MATTQYKTPGVYIQEPNSFPPSIVGVDTAVPCFIGYTQQAVDSDRRSIAMTPKRIESMAEFVQYFGGGYPELYYLATGDVPATDKDWGRISLDGSTEYRLAEVSTASFNLYNSMRLFFANGGGVCYIISCGLYDDDGQPASIEVDALTQALDVCASFTGPTMVVIPDAMLLADKDAYAAVATKMLQTCAKTGDRMALLDVWGADRATQQNWQDSVDDFREGLAAVPREMWRFGAAYFPPLVTSVVQPNEIDMSNFDGDAANQQTLKDALARVLGATYPAPPDPKAPAPATPPAAGTPPPVPVEANLTAKGATILKTYVAAIGTSVANDVVPLPAAAGEQAKLTHKQLTEALVATVPGFQQLLGAIAATQGVLPPSAALAGVWATNDALNGVWTAPANTGVATLIAPKIAVSSRDQEDLNVPTQGLAINAIRTFQGRGSLIWGARTLDSLSNDWRYIQVRRTMIYVEQSVTQALESMVFKPNTAQTWVTVTSMIESFLHGLWSAGGLMGGSPGEAYSVVAGLGSTMTPDDVLNGIMRVQVTLQMVRPAEFIELTFKQQMLGSG